MSLDCWPRRYCGWKNGLADWAWIAIKTDCCMTPRAVVLEAFPIHKSRVTLYQLYEWHVNKGAFINMREIFLQKVTRNPQRMSYNSS